MFLDYLLLEIFLLAANQLTPHKFPVLFLNTRDRLYNLIQAVMIIIIEILNPDGRYSTTFTCKN
jgi:hypothetical protein